MQQINVSILILQEEYAFQNQMLEQQLNETRIRKSIEIEEVPPFVQYCSPVKITVPMLSVVEPILFRPEPAPAPKFFPPAPAPAPASRPKLVFSRIRQRIKFFYILV